MANVAEAEPRQDIRARSVSTALKHMHENELSLALGHGPVALEGGNWSKEVRERVRRSSMAIYAYDRGPRHTSPQQEERTGVPYSLDSIHAWQGSGFCVGIETERVSAGFDDRGKEKFATKTFALVQTNHHVVSGSDSNFEYSVELFDGVNGGSGKGIRKAAEVLYRDYARDLAYIRVDISDTPFVAPLKLANADTVHVAQEVASVGNSLGAENNFVPGYITGEPTVVDEDDVDPDSGWIKGMWKLSAIISPGNSGGPTVNLKGEVIGMNTASLHGHHGAPVGHAISVKDFEVPAHHVRLFSRVQQRIEPLSRKSFGGGDDSKWRSYFDEGVRIYREEFAALYGQAESKAVHQKVLNDSGMLTMLITPLIGSLIRGDIDDMHRLEQCLASLETQFGIKLEILEAYRNAQASGPEEAKVFATKLAGRKQVNDARVATNNKNLRAHTARR